MPEFTTQDLLVVAGACVVAFFIGKYIKRKNERELREEMEAKKLQEAAEAASAVEAEIVSEGPLNAEPVEELEQDK